MDSKDYIFHKIWYLFRYVALKLEVGAGYGIMAMESFGKNRKKEEGSRYQVVNVRKNRIRMKEWKLKEMKEEHFSTAQQKELYNLKILKWFSSLKGIRKKCHTYNAYKECMYGISL